MKKVLASKVVDASLNAQSLNASFLSCLATKWKEVVGMLVIQIGLLKNKNIFNELFKETEDINLFLKIFASSGL